MVSRRIRLYEQSVYETLALPLLIFPPCTRSWLHYLFPPHTFHPADQQPLIVADVGSTRRTTDRSASRSPSPPASASLRRTPARQPRASPPHRVTTGSAFRGQPMLHPTTEPLQTPALPTTNDEPPASLELQGRDGGAAAGGGGGAAGGSSFSAALLRLKRQRLQSASAAAQLPPSAAAVAGGPPGGSASEGGQGPVRAEDVNLRRIRSAAPGLRLAVGAGAAQAGVSRLPQPPAAQQQPMARGREAADEPLQAEEGAGAAAGARPFLVRRSKTVASKKLDWSNVKPRTVSSR